MQIIQILLQKYGEDVKMILIVNDFINELLKDL